MSDTPDTSSFLPSDDELYAAIDAEADDIMSVPTGNTIKGGSEFLAKFSAPKPLSSLSPEDREIVSGRLNALPLAVRKDKEPELVQQFIAEKARSLRIKQGPGPNANALTKERWLLARQAADLDDQQDRIIAKLAEVKEYDSRTGAPIYSHPLGSEDRRQLEAELHRLHAIAANIRNGTEGQERLAKARERALAETKKRLEDEYVVQESKRLADANRVQARVEERAAAIGKRLKSYNI